MPKAFPTQSAEWAVYDFSPQLLKACGQLLEITREPTQRSAVAALIESVWTEHLERRRGGGAVALWDTLKVVFPAWPDKRERLYAATRVDSWYVTERVVEALVAVTIGEIARPADPASIVRFASELVADLDWRLACDEASSKDVRGIQEKRNLVHDARTRLAKGEIQRALETLFSLLITKD